MVKTKKKRNGKNGVIATGGKAIASGGYGCVFSPALKCENTSEREPNKISKLMTERHAIQEYDEINNIKQKLDTIKNYKDYFLIYDATLCRPAKLSSSDLSAFKEKCTALPKDNITKTNINAKLNETMALTLPNGGLPIDDYVYLNGGYDKLYHTHVSLVHLLKKGIIPMNQNNIYHSDIKDSNVLVDDSGSTIKTRLIDWGLSVEYKPDASSQFPKNWRNRPLQFNVPFSVVIFTDRFYEKYSDYLKKGGKVEEAELRPFVIDYLNEWIKERGAGHYKFINEIMFLLYSNTLTSVSDNSKPNVIESEITMPYIIDYIIDVLLHYTKFKADGSLNLREYLNEVYIKIVDLWGFIVVYYPFLEILSTNYFSLKESELKIFKQLQFIFNEYLYTPRHEPININNLLGDLHTLGKLLYFVAHGKKRMPSFKTSLATSEIRKTRKSKSKTKSSTIFKRKKLAKHFKNPFFLSIK